jgi:hypothetical protein
MLMIVGYSAHVSELAVLVLSHVGVEPKAFASELLLHSREQPSRI